MTSVTVRRFQTADWNTTRNKPETFPPSPHAHAQADVEGLGAALAGKQDATDALTVPRGSDATWPPRPVVGHVTWVDTAPDAPQVPPGMVAGDLYIGPDGMSGLGPGGTP